jgi:hypothetical protein
MTPENLYTESWLLAYEAAHRNWLPTGGDYLSQDPFFGWPHKAGVSFCQLPSDSGVGYLDLPVPVGGYID